MLGFAMVGASSGPPDSMTRTSAPEPDNSAARTEPAAPAPTTMKSYRLSSFASLIILNSQDLDSAAQIFRRSVGGSHRRQSTTGLSQRWREAHQRGLGIRDNKG